MSECNLFPIEEVFKRWCTEFTWAVSQITEPGSDGIQGGSARRSERGGGFGFAFCFGIA